MSRLLPTRPRAGTNRRRRKVSDDRLLGLLGLGERGGRVVIGVDGTRAVLQRNDCAVVVMAEDASPRAVAKVRALAAGKGVTVITGPSADRLGARLGRPPVMVVAVRDRALAAGLLAAHDHRDGT